ncbi:MAG: cation-translocating P-type ATPase [Synechococcus sp.]
MLLSASQPIWSLPPEQVLRTLQTTARGLSPEEARTRLERFGPNRLPAQRRRPLLLRFLDQLVHFMALLLWVAGALAFLAGTPPLGWAIWAVVVVNGVFSFWQEFQAERTLAALGRSLPREVRVWRGGELCVIAAEALVPGDLLQLEEGDRVPADARLVEAHDLYLDTAVLTGESLPVARHAQAQVARPGPGAPEQGNLVLAGCTVASGRGSAVVYATGAESEFGHVAHLTAATDRGASTLELQIRHIVRTITTVALVVGAATFLLDLLFVGMGPLESLLFAVGILVAFVPEGLLPQVTLTLALNVRRMAARQALVRRLSAVESLGSVSVICSDKTGTLTCNAMALQETWLPDSDPALRRRLLRAATLCSNARLERSENPSEPWRALGDPTETALLLAAVEAGLFPEQQQRRFPRRREVPFDSHRRRMSVLVEAAAAPVAGAAGVPDDPEDWGAGPDWSGRVVLTKGAPPEVLERCSTLAGPQGPRPLGEAERARGARRPRRLRRSGLPGDRGGPAAPGGGVRFGGPGA